jgi:hypothetical protein
MRLGSFVVMRRLLCLLFVFLAAFASADLSFGQAAPAASGSPPPSRIDLFAGYAYFHPFNSDIANITYPAVPLGGVGSVAGYFTSHLGIQVEGQVSPNGPADNNCVYTAQAGPILRLQRGRLVPFFHALGGGAIVGGPLAQKCNVWGWGATGGFGLDIILPVLHDHLALRPIQADFTYAQIDNGPQMNGGFQGGLGQVYAARVSAGLTFRFGELKPAEEKVAPSFNCSADPGDPYPGDPVTITATTLNLNPKRKPTYLWSASAGKVAGNGPSAAVDTAGMAAGTYVVTGKLVEGDRQRLVASCSSSFTVRNYEPPTVACSSDKAAINSGDQVTITATARSPQNRPLTYTYTATNGVITGDGPAARLSTAGANPGNITVTCMVTDDRGQKASANASIVVATPAPPPTPVIPTVQSLCTITFDLDKERPDRVDNESKACLDDVALSLNREAGDRLLLIGSHANRETNRDAAIRAMNAAQYLTKEKGIDPTRLDLRIGPDNSRSVALLLVPPGAVIDPGIATSFDASSIKRTGEAYGTPRTTAPTPRRKKRKPVTPPQ